MATFLQLSGGLIAILGGAAWTVFWLAQAQSGGWRPNGVLFALLGFALLCMTIGLGTLGMREGISRTAKFGLIIAMIGTSAAALASVVGAIALGVFAASLRDSMPLFLVTFLGELFMSGGLALFSIANLQDRVLSRWNGLPLLMLLVLVPSWTLEHPAVPWLGAIYGAGWVLLGYRLMSDFNQQRLAPSGG